MNAVYKTFDKVAIEYDFMATLLDNKNRFFQVNLSTRKGAALDIGCGSGLLALELAKNYESVVGIDISEEMLAIARFKRFAPNIQYICMDASQLSLNTKFDLIVSATTLHHMPNLPSILQAIKQLLKPGGKIAILDNVSEVETPATIAYIVGAVKDFIPDGVKYGIGNARRLFNFRTSEPWLRHLASDRYLSEQQFKEIYSHFFPDCSFTKLGCFMGVTWEYR